MISKLILGTVQFGLNYGINNPKGKPENDEVQKILAYAEKSGIQILDTADAYGNADELVADYIKANGESFKINTKFKGSNISLSNQIKESLITLNIDKIDTYFYHRFNDYNYENNYLDQLLKLKDDNLIKKIGLSVYSNEEFESAIKSNYIDVIQFPFNLLDNYQQRGKLMRLAKSEGKELQVRSVFLQGLFFKDVNDLPEKLIPLKSYLIQLRETSKSHRISMEELALKYAMQQPEIDYVIIGVDNLNQLKRNIEIANEKIESHVIGEVNNIEVKETELLYPKNWN